MQPLSDTAFKSIAGLMYQSVGLAFAESKSSLISSRLAPRIQKLGLETFEAYAELIAGQDDGGEFQVAVDLLTTNETYFFREPKHFERLTTELQKSRQNRIRIWSAAASFGDEAYSLAMLLSDLQRLGKVGDDWQILGTDISDRVLKSAVEAVYPEDRLRFVDPARLKRYCLKGEGSAEGMSKIVDALRARVKFGQLNLCQPDIDLEMFDFIFLRNVLIYFDQKTKVEVVDRVLRQLRPGGLFFIGTAEGRVSCSTPLEAIEPGVFRKKNPAA